MPGILVPLAIDCFTFFNELELLEFRLKLLDATVDRFVIAESNITHSGKPKPYYFEENKKRFSPEFRNRLDNVIKFNPIDEEVGKLIAKKELVKLEEKTKMRNIEIVMCYDSLIEGILKKAKIKETPIQK